jgi:hypothetical protein
MTLPHVIITFLPFSHYSDIDISGDYETFSFNIYLSHLNLRIMPGSVSVI